MNSRTQKANTCSTIAAFVSVIPLLGWAVSGFLILVSFILAVCAIGANEQGGIRALINTFLAIPVAILAASLTIYIIGA